MPITIFGWLAIVRHRLVWIPWRHTLRARRPSLRSHFPIFFEYSLIGKLFSGH